MAQNHLQVLEFSDFDGNETALRSASVHSVECGLLINIWLVA